MIFFTADQHFCHKNIIKYCHRPFSSLIEMHEVLIEKWNKKVSKDDLVYCLGDFCLGNIVQYHEIRKRLNGSIFLILGDHDKLFQNMNTDNMFKGKTPLLNLTYSGQPVTLCHWKMEVWAKSHYNSFHLFAHSHGKLEPKGKSWDVGVDNNNFEPLSWFEIVEIMKNRPDNFNLIKKNVDSLINSPLDFI